MKIDLNSYLESYDVLDSFFCKNETEGTTDINPAEVVFLCDEHYSKTTIANQILLKRVYTKNCVVLAEYPKGEAIDRENDPAIMFVKKEEVEISGWDSPETEKVFAEARLADSEYKWLKAMTDTFLERQRSLCEALDASRKQVGSDGRIYVLLGTAHIFLDGPNPPQEFIKGTQMIKDHLKTHKYSYVVIKKNDRKSIGEDHPCFQELCASWNKNAYKYKREAVIIGNRIIEIPKNTLPSYDEMNNSFKPIPTKLDFTKLIIPTTNPKLDLVKLDLDESVSELLMTRICRAFGSFIWRLAESSLGIPEQSQ